jgi:hypothetical protein
MLIIIYLHKISCGSVIENPGNEYYEMRQFYMVRIGLKVKRQRTKAIIIL